MPSKPTAPSGLGDVPRLFLNQAADENIHPSPMIPLADLATVRSGYAVRGKNRCDSGKFILMQEKDITSGLAAPLERFERKRVPVQHFLQAGDIVMKLRGSVNTAMVMVAPEPGTVCCAGLAVIRVFDAGRVLPAYLEWWLNGVETQTALARYERVGRGRVVNAEGLRAVGVLLPEIERQRKIVVAHGLNLQITAMERELIEKKRRYAEAAMRVFAGKIG